MKVDLKSLKITKLRWWRCLDHIPKIDTSYQKAKETIKNLLHEAIKIRLTSDVKIATSLSGGIDSGIIFSELNKNFPDKFIVSFGYTGWSSGQLEKEIQQGSWVIIPANEQIIFSTKSDKKIEEASKLAGFNLNLVSSNYGKA